MPWIGWSVYLAARAKHRRAEAIGALASGIGALGNAQQQQKRFNQLFSAFFESQLWFHIPASHAEAIAGLAAGLWGLENAQERLNRFEQLKDKALAIEDDFSRATATGGLAASLWALAPEHRLLLRCGLPHRRQGSQAGCTSALAVAGCRSPTTRPSTLNRNRGLKSDSTSPIRLDPVRCLSRYWWMGRL